MSGLHAAAFALVEEVAFAGARLALDDDGTISTYGDLPEALDARVDAMMGVGEHRAGLPPHRALRAILAAPSRGLRELLTLSTGFAKLPVPYTLRFARKGASAVMTTSGAVYKRELAAGVPVFVLREWDVAAQAYERGRAGPAQLDAWLAAKSRGPWLLTPELADVAPGGESPVVSFGELLEGLGAEGVEVET